MELCEFHGKIYGKHNNQLFVFEPTWDTFRPIEKVAWNGEHYVTVDKKYKTDLFDDFYGFGSMEMKNLCKQLIQDTELETAKLITDSVLFWKWCGETEAKWWFDRACVFSDGCVNRDVSGWKEYLHYLQVRSKTIRRPLRGRMTRRHLIAK
jgi:hypothetical protein